MTAPTAEATSSSLPADAVALAAAHRARQQAIAAAAVASTGRLWKFLDQVGWPGIRSRVVGQTQAAMREAARGTQAYTAAVARAGGLEPAPAGQVNEPTFAATASDGRPLDTLLDQPAREVEEFTSQGMTKEQARAIAARHLRRIIETQVADSARVATGVAVANDRSLEGYVRHLTLPSCSRCIILAGKWYRWSAGFDRHPQCFPAGTVVAGPETSAATRRWYEGELVHLATASGEKLSLTGNHPVLTRRGWVPAHLLQEGDEVVRSTRPKGAAPLVVPDHQQVPARIEDVWRALGMAGLHRMPAAAEDFHGDGQRGEVDVVYADGPLWRVGDLALLEQCRELALAVGGVFAPTLDVQRVPVLVDDGHAVHPPSAVRGGGLLLASLGGHLRGPGLAGVARPATLDARALKARSDDVAAHAVLAAEGEFTRAREVRGDDLLDRQLFVAPRWDAPGGPLTVENRGAYASRGADLFKRLASQVELDRLVDVRRVEWSGHVYSLTSVEGWHSANSLIVSNCDCVHVPAAESVDPPSPREAYDAMTDEERRKAGWSGHDQRAIEDGADLNQVTNYRRELKSVNIAGRPTQITTVGTTRRGVAGKRLGADKGSKQGGRYRRAPVVRLTPESIYGEAERLGWSRDETIRQLTRFGYIL